MGGIAATLVLVPPFQWVECFGVNTFTDAAGGTLAPVGLMPLAAMWLVVVAATALKAVRGGRDAERSKAPVG